MLGQSGPYAAPCCFHVGPSDTYVVQSWPDVDPTKKPNAKTMEKPMDSQGFASMLTPCWPIFDALLVHLGAMLAHLGLCWVVLGLCWSVLGARWGHLRAMLARLEAMLSQHARRNARRRTKTQTYRKKSRNPMLRRVPPRFAPGSSQVPPRLTRFRGRGRRQGRRASITFGYHRRPPARARARGRRPDYASTCSYCAQI